MKTCIRIKSTCPQCSSDKIKLKDQFTGPYWFCTDCACAFNFPKQERILEKNMPYLKEVCPKCGSPATDKGIAPLTPNGPEYYTCAVCKHIFSRPKIVSTESLEIEENMKYIKDTKIDTSSEKVKCCPKCSEPMFENDKNCYQCKKCKYACVQINRPDISKGSMTFEQFDKFQELLFAEVVRMKDTKGKEYAHSEDRFANFNRLADRLSLSNIKIAWVYLMKHIDGIESYIREEREFSTEGIQGRIVDAITYLTLIGGMIEANKKEEDK